MKNTYSCGNLVMGLSVFSLFLEFPWTDPAQISSSFVFPLSGLVNNYFLCPNLEKGVALFVGSVKSTFPLHFGSETSKTWEKTSENVWFSSGSEKITFSRVFSHVLQVSDPKWNGTSWFYTTANIGYSLNKN